MPEFVTPRKVQLAAKAGFDRIKRYRLARAMFIREYAGQYYRQKYGWTGETPINLIFNTIRAWVPNIVMDYPINQVTTEIVTHRDYAELLSLALNFSQRSTGLKKNLRAWIVDAIFAMGIMKTGLCTGDQKIAFGDIDVDVGELYNEHVDLDNLTIDPTCTSLDKAAFLGDLISMPRQLLLDFDIYDHDLVMQLPSAWTHPDGDKRISELTQQYGLSRELRELQDKVNVVELWIPGADALVTIPDPRVTTFDKYISQTDYYGPKKGPYTFLSLTPPVPNNPLPVAPVSVWYDLHKMANRTFTKIMDQVDDQKNVLLYNPALADEAQDVLDAQNNESVACSDPSGIQVVSFGGQKDSGNERMLAQLQIWYNYIAGNPDQMAGQKTPKGGRQTATQSQILQSNASIGIEDIRGIVYDETAEISKKDAWYLHTDPLMNLPLAKRTTGGDYVQIVLTPEQRQGDFLEYIFKIVAKSMSRLDPTIRAKRIIEFGTNVIPAAVMAAMQMMQMGQKFNLQRYLTKLANELEIGDWLQDVFDDPEFEEKMMAFAQLGPQNAGKGTLSPKGIAQNEGFPLKRNILTPGQEFNQNAQTGANESQSTMQGIY